MRRALILTVVLVALGATVALARSVPTVVSVTTAPTAQEGGGLEVTVFANPVRSADRPVVGATYMSWVKVRFRCAEASEGDAPPKLYEAEGNADERYDYGRPFAVKLSDVEVFDTAGDREKAAFKVAITLKGKITKISKKATKGRGTVVVAAPGCTAGPLKWRGAGRVRTQS